MSEAMAIGYLAVCSRFDFKWKGIPLWTLAIGSALGVTLVGVRAMNTGCFDWMEICMGLIPGGCATLFSLISEDKIGLGDGLVLFTVGLMLGFRVTLVAAIFGLFFATLVGIGLLVLRRGSMQSTIPYVPFLTLGVLLVLLMR